MFSWNNIQQNIDDLWEILLERETYFFVVTNCSLCKLKNMGKLIIFLAGCFACAHCFCNFVVTYARPIRFNFQYFMNSATCFEIELNIRCNFESLKITAFPSFLLLFFSRNVSSIEKRTSHRIRVSLFNSPSLNRRFLNNHSRKN